MAASGLREQAEQFGQIETAPFGEYGGLPERQDGRRDDHLVARLGHLARTQGTEMNRVAARGVHRPRVRDITFLTTDHDRQRAGFGTFDAAGDRALAGSTSWWQVCHASQRALERPAPRSVLMVFIVMRESTRAMAGSPISWVVSQRS